MSSSKAKLTLYTAGTPNGWKPSITLEELEIPYEVKSISLPENEQKQDWFLKINPNGRNSSCLKRDIKKQTEVMSWLMFQMGGLGPMQGQANHFVRYAPEQIEYAKNRYVNETNRLYQVLDSHLKIHEWLAADQYTIADIANFSWVFAYFWAGATIDDKPHLKAWYEKILARPAVQKGLDVPEENSFKKGGSQISEEEIQTMVEEARKVMVSTDKK